MEFNPQELLKAGIDPKELPNLWQMLDNFQSKMADVHASLRNPAEKQALGEVLEQLQQARGQAQDVLPRSLEKMKGDAAALQVEMDELARRYEETRAEVERRSAERPTRTAAPEPRPPEYDAGAARPEVPGDELREELLRSVGAHPVERSAAEDHRNIWDDLTRSVEIKVERPDQGPKATEAEPPAEKADPRGPDEWTKEF